MIRLGFLLTLLASVAFADQVVVQLTACNTSTPGICEILPIPAGESYGSVTKTLVDGSGNPISSGTGNILIELVLTDGLLLINNGLAFNSTSTLSSGSVTGISSPYYGPLQTGGTAMDGFTTGQSTFQYYVPSTVSGLSDPSKLSATLTFTITGPFSTVEVVDQPTSQGFEWAAEVGKPGCGLSACTGYIAGPDGVVPAPGVPEPGTLALLGCGLVAMGMIRHWRKRNAGPPLP